jgi:16S rRNA C1402 N4-methylase RsmH
MILERVLSYVKTLLQRVVSEGDIVIDGTAGNGHDTLFLAKLVGQSGHVYAFDIQIEAIEATKQKLGEFAPQATVILDGHENLTKYVTHEISAAVFNLGYLPGANHSTITRPNTTIKAVESCLRLLKVGGVIVIVVYHGHEGGAIERDALIQYVTELPQASIQVLRYEFINQVNQAPFILAIEKMKQI